LLKEDLNIPIQLKKPALTKKQKSLRLSFAKQNRSRNWNNVIYTDETSVTLGPRTKKIWKRRGEKSIH
jgi:hypothetical protein